METLPNWLLAAVAAAGVTAFAFDVVPTPVVRVAPLLTPVPIAPVAPPL